MKTDLFDLTLTEFCFESYCLRLNEAINSISLNRLSQTTGISRNTLKKYRNAETSPDLLRLNQIAVATQFSLTWLLFGHPIDKRPHSSQNSH